MQFWETTVYLEWISQGMEHDTVSKNCNYWICRRARDMTERQVALLGLIGLLWSTPHKNCSQLKISIFNQDPHSFVRKKARCLMEHSMK